MEYTTTITLELSDEAIEVIHEIQAATGDDDASIFRKALALYSVCVAAHHDGLAVGVADDASVLETEFTGF